MSSTNAARRRAQQLRRVRSRRGGRGGGDPVSFRLIVCGTAFVLLVALKLLFPAQLEQLAGSVRQLIGQDADFKEAFAAVGRGISGERPMGDSLQEAYSAVFKPELQLEPEETAEPPLREEQTQPAGSGTEGAAEPEKRLLRYTALSLPEADRVVMREVVITPEAPAAELLRQPSGEGGEAPAQPAGEEAEIPDETEAMYVYTMPSMPENASLELRNLGFDHCTPVQGQLSSVFGWREHPVEGGNRFHYGVDLAADTGTDVLAFADGEVYAVGESSTLGNYIMLRHEGGYVTLYAHCSRIVADSGSVAMGEKIAEVGATGLVTGPHLHFELHDGELYLNPIYYVQVG